MKLTPLTEHERGDYIEPNHHVPRWCKRCRSRVRVTNENGRRVARCIRCGREVQP